MDVSVLQTALLEAKEEIIPCGAISECVGADSAPATSRGWTRPCSASLVLRAFELFNTV